MELRPEAPQTKRPAGALAGQAWKKVFWNYFPFRPWLLPTPVTKS